MTGRLKAWLRAHPVAAKIIGTSGWLLLERLGALGLALVAGVAVARQLGPENWGQLQYSLAFVSLFGGMAVLGLNGVAVQEWAGERSPDAMVLGTVLGLRLAAALVLLGVVCVAAWWWHPAGDPSRALIYVLAALLPLSIFDAFEYRLMAAQDGSALVRAKFPASLLAALFKLALVAFGAPLIAFAGAELATAAFNLSALALAWWRTAPAKARHPHFDKGLALRLLKLSWPMIFSSLAVALYMRLDQIMLKHMADSDQVGIYAAAVKLSELWYLVPTILVAAAAPAIYKAYDQDKALFQKRVQRLFGTLSLAALVVMLPVALLSGPLVRTLFGSAFAASGPVLSVHIFSAWFVFQGVAQGVWDTAHGLQRFSLLRTLCGATMNILLNLWLIPAHGAVGAAWATLFSQAMASTVANLFHPKTRPAFWLQLSSLGSLFQESQ